MARNQLWDEQGLPVLDDASQAGLEDFWETYDACYDETRAELMRLARELPEISAVIREMSSDELEEQSRRSRELMRSAIHDGEWAGYLEHQRAQGATYAAMNVSIREWYELVSVFQKIVTPALAEAHADDPDRLSAAVAGMDDYIGITMTVITEEYLRTKEKQIAQQAEAIRELSTPVLEVREKLLLLPIVGLLDTERAQLLTDHLLHSIQETGARVVVMDLTGVPTVDTQVTQYLLDTLAAARLMGVELVVTGVSPQIAQALVALGVDLNVHTAGVLRRGLEMAEELMNPESPADEEVEQVAGGVGGAGA